MTSRHVLLTLLVLSSCGDQLLPPQTDSVDSQLGTPVTVSFQNGVTPTTAYSGTTDTTLQQSTPTTNLGTALTVQADRDAPAGSGQSVNGLLRFDLSSIPTSGTVQAAKLTLNVSNATSGAGYFVVAASRSWVELQATWVNAATGSAWATAGARGATDRATTILGTLSPTATGTYTLTLNADGIKAVQGWVTNPASNFGFAIDAVDDMDGLAFDSSEAATAGNRPQLSVTWAPVTSTGTGTGLLGQYFSDVSFTTKVLARTDATVSFDWGTGSPGTGVPADNFSARWSGQIAPLYSEAYTFFTQSDDGVRLWVNGTQIINNWSDHGSTENSGAITLTAGQKYDLKLEYYERGGGAVSRLSWSSAHQVKQIVPATQLYPATDVPNPPPPPPPVGPVTDLDASGTVIPDSSYTIPSNAIFMATTGSDSNPGTQAAPVKTLNRAWALASAGTIVIRGGVYRDGYLNGSTYGIGNRSITLQAFPHEKVWFDGADVIASSQFASDGAGHWSIAWATPSFCQNGYRTRAWYAQDTGNQGPCTHIDMSRDATNLAAGDPQMVFIDGAYVHEVKTLAEATGSNFFYDWSAQRLYLGTNPAGHTVELAARAVLLVMGGTATVNVKILGIGIRKYATNEYSNQTSGAITIYGSNVLVENSVFTQMAGGALVIGSQGSVVRHSVLANNGFNGIGSNGHTHSSGAIDGLVIENSLISGNNKERFGTGCDLSCAQAGVKLGHMNGFTMRNNVVQNNVGWGLWCDLECKNGVFVNNLVRNNERGGIIYEVSDNGVIASNMVYGNAGGCGIRVCSANTRVYNNTVVKNGGNADIWVYDDPRSLNVDGWTDVGPDTRNVSVVNNIVSGSNWTLRVTGKKPAPNTTPDQFFTVFDYNAYFRSASQGFAVWEPIGAATNYLSDAQFSSARQLDQHSIDIAGGADPFFVDAASNDFRVRAGSAPYRTGTSIPADIAAAIGSPTTGQDRGAIHWPGN